MAHYRSMIFDFDGTLADTLSETRRIFNTLAPDYGIRTVEEEEIHALRHLSLKELLAHLKIPKRRVPVLIARGTGMMRANITNLPMIPGMSDVVRTLRRHCECLGILTSNASANVEAFLECHGLIDHFDFVSSTSKLTGKAKHLKAIQKTFSLRSEELLYIGDELRDLKASRKADVPMAAVTWGFNSKESLAAAKPDFLIERPEDFLKLVAQPPHIT